jgi:hypothetical protein
MGSLKANVSLKWPSKAMPFAEPGISSTGKFAKHLSFVSDRDDPRSRMTIMVPNFYQQPYIVVLLIRIID